MTTSTCLPRRSSALLLLLLHLTSPSAALSLARPSLSAALTSIGLRGRALERLVDQHAANVDDAAGAAALGVALGQLEAAGVNASAVAVVLRRQPRALEHLLAAPPTLGAGHVTQSSLGASGEIYAHTAFLLRAGVL